MNAKKVTILFLLISLTLSGCASQYGVIRTPKIPLYNQTISFGSVEYIPILRYCEYYDVDWDWDLVAQRIELKKDNQKLVLRPDSKLALLDGNPVEFNEKVEYKNGTAYIPVSAAIYISKRLFELEGKPIPSRGVHNIRTVVIDPGHGGKDPGAIGRYGGKEKNIVLDVSKRLKNKLKKKGLNVYLTRERDTFIPLKKRPRIAKSKNADLFISIHANASRRSRAKGFEVYYLSEATDDNARALAASENASLKFENGNGENNNTSSNDPTVWDLKLTEQRRQSKGLAYYICNIASDNLNMKKRGVKGARFAVLRGAESPAILVEIGFLSNRREESQLKTSSFRDKIASAIAESIVAYKREYEKTNGFSR